MSTVALASPADAHALFLPIAIAIAKHNALIRSSFPVTDPFYRQVEACFFGAFWDMPIQLLAFLDAAEKSCRCSGEQHAGFAQRMKNEIMAARCGAKPVRNQRGEIKWKRRLTFASMTLPDEIEARARAFFTSVYSLQNVDRRTLRLQEKGFWQRYALLRKSQRRARRDKEDIYRVLLSLRKRLPDELAVAVIRMAL